MPKSKNKKSGLRKVKKHIDQLDLPAKNKIKAIALKFDVDKDKAPKIIATGKGAVADMILKVAEEHRVPFYEDQALADLLGKLELDREIPPELYTMVAEVLAFVYQLDKLAKKRKRVKKKYGKKK